jgi:hypothetical protein
MTRKLMLLAILIASSVLAFTQTEQRAYFPYQGDWLGADGGYSVDLGNGSSLWLFDDTFINTNGQRSGAWFPRNTVGLTPRSQCPWNVSCTQATYYWGTNVTSVFNQDLPNSSYLYWPLDGFMYNGSLYVVLNQFYQPSGTQAQSSGVYLVQVTNPTQSPWNWSIPASNYRQIFSGSSLVPGVSMVVNMGPSGNPFPNDPNGAMYAYFLSYLPNGTNSYMALMRLPLADIAGTGSIAIGTDANWQYLNNVGQFQGWTTGTTVPGNMKVLMSPGFTEGTLRYHASTNQWIALFTDENSNGGYPANQAYYSLSSLITGNFTSQESLFAFPEMATSNPDYIANAMCYAVKEHVEYESTSTPLVFTYACNDETSDGQIYTDMNLYRPEMVGMNLPSQ